MTDEDPVKQAATSVIIAFTLVGATGAIVIALLVVTFQWFGARARHDRAEEP